jgi:4-hydroxy-tetrahydrodipicolinate reductase
MNIALIGYGKMGKAIEEIAIQNGHKIVLKVSEPNLSDFTTENIKMADVAIEFSTPESAFNNIVKCLSNGIPTVSGTTAWLDKLQDAQILAQQKNTSFLYASNFSIGVNLFFALNKHLAKLMASHTEYAISMEEIHHTAKLDAPSGTAITLAQGIMEQNHYKTNYINNATQQPDAIGIVSKRIDPAPGTHSIKYSSPIDDIEIIHTAHSRIGFASGALAAANFIHDKKGIFTMQDVLGI